jgi:hypothetical protein
MKYLAGLVVLIVLVGCSTHYRNTIHPSARQPEFNKDWYECKEMEIDYSTVWSCMTGRGWQPVKD